MFSGTRLRSLLKACKRPADIILHHHKEIITQQYPDNKDTLVLPERFRVKW